MSQEKSLIKRILGGRSQRVPFSETESEKFKAYWDLVVEKAMEQDSSLIESAQVDPFYQAVEKASLQVHDEVVTQSKHDAQRRRLLTLATLGTIGLGIGVMTVPPIYDWATSPYTDSFMDREMTEDEKKKLESTQMLLREMTPPAKSGWAISFDKKDPTKKWAPESSFLSPRVQNLRQGKVFSVFAQGRTQSSMIWLNSYTNTQGITLPVMELETIAGPDPRIINPTQQVDPGLDTTAIKMTNINSNASGYIALRRIATPGGHYFEVSSLKREPV